MSLVLNANIEKETNLNEIRKKLYEKMKIYKHFIVAVNTDFAKNIAFYVPC